LLTAASLVTSAAVMATALMAPGFGCATFGAWIDRIQVVFAALNAAAFMGAFTKDVSSFDTDLSPGIVLIAAVSSATRLRGTGMMFLLFVGPEQLATLMSRPCTARRFMPVMEFSTEHEAVQG
jgi:hypothetical protein